MTIGSGPPGWRAGSRCPAGPALWPDHNLLALRPFTKALTPKHRFWTARSLGYLAATCVVACSSSSSERPPAGGNRGENGGGGGAGNGGTGNGGAAGVGGIDIGIVRDGGTSADAPVSTPGPFVRDDCANG